MTAGKNSSRESRKANTSKQAIALRRAAINFARQVNDEREDAYDVKAVRLNAKLRKAAREFAKMWP